MIRAVLKFEVKESRLSIDCQKAKLAEPRDITAEDREQFTRWTKSYGRVLSDSSSRDPGDVLLNVGREIYQWLNGAEGWMERLFRSSAQPPFILEFTVSPEAGEEERCFLEVPWELAADGQGHLAADPYRFYMPVRRVGEPGGEGELSPYRFHAVFMAAAPRDSVSLRFEEEETAVLDAAGSTGMDLTVEDSGSLTLLGDCMARETKTHRVDVLHISCHGTFGKTNDGKREPRLVLETGEGDQSPTTAAELDRALGGNKPGLLFLSACKTSDPGVFLTSFSASMIRHGVPAVLGWGGSVGDVEATRFAASLYGGLSRGEAVEEAAARARMDLLERGKPGESAGTAESREWHLARLYLGAGGGKLCGGQKAIRRRGPEYGHKEFLNAKDSEIPVAGRREFVGRRRQLQAVLREFRQPQYAGVLLHGFGRQGKSSLAARAANRMTDHKLVVVYKHYDALSVLDAVEYFAGTQEVRELVEAGKARVRDDGAALFGVLKDLLEGPCCEDPVLLVLDDFERALEDPVKGERHRVRSDLVDTVRSVIDAFDSASGRTRSRLLITCRYVFTLPHRGRDLGSRLFAIPLPPMETYEGMKQAAAKNKALGAKGSGVDKDRMARCVHAGQGNPGLQDLLFSLCLESPKAGDDALAAVEEYVASGREPDEEKLRKFIGNLAVRRLMGLLSPGEKYLLRASTLFQVPVPLEVLALMGQELGVKPAVKPGERFAFRLMGFGLWEPFEDMVNKEETAVAIHALARGEAGKLSDKESSELAKMVVKDLFRRWGGDKGKRPYAADIQLSYLAVAAKEPSVLASTALYAVRALEKRFEYRAAARLAGEVIRVLDNAKSNVSVGLLLAACEVSRLIDDIENALVYIKRALEILAPQKDSENYLIALITFGRLLVMSGSPDKALIYLEEAIAVSKSDRFLRERSIVLGEIAQIKINRGQVDEALKLIEEKSIICEEIGDIDGKANTLWDLAQIELQRKSNKKASEYLSESYAILLKLERLDGICVVGLDLGDLLCRDGQTGEGLKILEQSRDGFRKLGQEEMAAQAQKLIDTFSK
jgi:tetratricopeptide (TPR) repeat protein